MNSESRELENSVMKRSPILYGIDGCPAGWLCVSCPTDGGETPQAEIIPTLDSLTQRLKPDDIVAIDMPIGLPADTMDDTNRRACDQIARDKLDGRRNSVFFAPSRGILGHLTSHVTASAWHETHTGRGISRQCYFILHKVLELDVWIGSHPGIARIFEVHPELSFAHWNGGRDPIPMLHRKSKSEGRAERQSKVDSEWPGAFDIAVEALGAGSCKRPDGGRKRLWAKDDLLDSFAALWSAKRIASNQAVSYPMGDPPPGAIGRSMKIHA